MLGIAGVCVWINVRDVQINRIAWVECRIHLDRLSYYEIFHCINLKYLFVCKRHKVYVLNSRFNVSLSKFVDPDFAFCKLVSFFQRVNPGSFIMLIDSMKLICLLPYFSHTVLWRIKCNSFTFDCFLNFVRQKPWFTLPLIHI